MECSPVTNSQSMRRLVAYSGFGLVGLGLAACGESSTAPGGEQEVISRVTLTLTPANGGAPLTAFIEDADGNGPGAPSAQVGALALVRGASYTGTVKFENRLVNPPEDITEEVEEEANEHRVYYTVTGSGVTITTTDRDPQGRPLGLAFTKAVGATSAAGTTRVVLCHYDDAPKNGSSTSCQGETDIDVTFNFTIAN
jgi:hypothetical protein